MDKTVQIFEITYYDTKNNCDIRLVMPSILDVKYLIHNQEDLLDMLLLKQLKVTPVHVMKGSQMYRVALQNRLVNTQS